MYATYCLQIKYVFKHQKGQKMTPLYRIWNIDKLEYVQDVQGIYIDLEGNLQRARGIKPKNYIIERCTGEQDTSGKFIYEGDVLSTYPTVVSSVHVVVNFEAGNFVLEDIQGYEDITFEDVLVIIGNIHENPDLLFAD